MPNNCNLPANNFVFILIAIAFLHNSLNLYILQMVTLTRIYAFKLCSALESSEVSPRVTGHLIITVRVINRADQKGFQHKSDDK